MSNHDKYSNELIIGMNMQAEEDDVTAKSNRWMRWSNNLTKPWAGAEGLLGSGFRLPDRIGTDLNQHQTHLGCTLLAKGENGELKPVGFDPPTFLV